MNKITQSYEKDLSRENFFQIYNLIDRVILMIRIIMGTEDAKQLRLEKLKKFLDGFNPEEKIYEEWY